MYLGNEKEKKKGKSYKLLTTAIVETQEIDLVIYTNKGFRIENVKFDKNKCTKEVVPKLTNYSRLKQIKLLM